MPERLIVADYIFKSPHGGKILTENSRWILQAYIDELLARIKELEDNEKR